MNSLFTQLNSKTHKATLLFVLFLGLCFTFSSVYADFNVEEQTPKDVVAKVIFKEQVAQNVGQPSDRIGAGLIVAEPPPLPTVWTLSAGHSVGQDLQLWADIAGWKVIWTLQKDWSVPANSSFGGDFEAATKSVVTTLSSNGALIHAQFYAGNKTVVVTGPGVSE